MGLDQYAYVGYAGQRRAYWDNYTIDENGCIQSVEQTEPIELATWRKHPNLQGYMCTLWESKGRPHDIDDINDDEELIFNGIELELTWDDLDKLERVIAENKLLAACGFFWGDNADDFYRKKDLEFIRKAKAETFNALKVFYNSSW